MLYLYNLCRASCNLILRFFLCLFLLLHFILSLDMCEFVRYFFFIPCAYIRDVLMNQQSPVWHESHLMNISGWFRTIFGNWTNFGWLPFSTRLSFWGKCVIMMQPWETLCAIVNRLIIFPHGFFTHMPHTYTYFFPRYGRKYQLSLEIIC